MEVPQKTNGRMVPMQPFCFSLPWAVTKHVRLELLYPATLRFPVSTREHPLAKLKPSTRKKVSIRNKQEKSAKKMSGRTLSGGRLCIASVPGCWGLNSRVGGTHQEKTSLYLRDRKRRDFLRLIL